MKKVYSDIDKLLKDVQSDIDDVLMNEVLDTVRDIEMEHVQEDVFSVYSPSIYRRRSSGGIDDPENVKAEVKNGVMTVRNDTPFNDDYATQNHGIGLAYMLNEGGNSEHDYDYGFRSIEAPYSNPRPFIDNTIEELDRTDAVEKALKKGLKRHDIDLK